MNPMRHVRSMICAPEPTTIGRSATSTNSKSSLATADRLSGKSSGACQRAYEDLWIEKLELKLSLPTSVETIAPAAFEFSAIAEGDDAPKFAEIDAVVAEIVTKCPVA